ncbi:hypothetical protein DFJ73DRAFT_233660 [Zopfochytrium polystomum]|nr:hypothetical protein DFJ73DRAFT_233660 [Zopfochytrium polystomum]
MAQGASVTGSAIAQGARATGNAALYGVDAVGAAALKTAELSEAAKTTIASSVYQGGASALAAGTSIKSGLAGLADSVVTGAKVAAGSVSQGATKAGTLIAQGAAAAGNAALSGVDAIGAAALKTSEATESAKSKITTTVYKGGEDLLTNTSSAFQAASSAVLDTAVTAGSSIKYAAGAASSTVYAGAESAGAVTAEGATVTKQAASNVGATLFGAGKSAVSAVTSLLGRRPESGGSPTPAAGGVVTTATSSSQPSYSTVSGSEGTLEYATVTVRKQVLDRKTNEVVDTVEIPLEVPAIAMEGWWGRMVAWVTARYPAFDAEKFLTSVSETQEVTDETFAVSLKIAGAFVTEDEVKQLAEVVIGEGDATRCKKILVVVRKIVRIVGAKATIEQVAPVFQHVTTRTTRITIKIRRILTAEQVEAGCQETEETIDIPPLALAWWQKWMVSVIRRSKSFSMTVFLAVLGDYEDVNDRTVMEAFTAAGASVSHSELQEMRRDPSSGAGVLTTTWTALKFVRRVVRICGVDAVKQQIVPLLWTSDDHHDTLTASSSHDDLSTVESSYAVTPSTSYMPSPERKPFGMSSSPRNSLVACLVLWFSISSSYRRSNYVFPSSVHRR